MVPLASEGALRGKEGFCKPWVSWAGCTSGTAGLWEWWSGVQPVSMSYFDSQPLHPDVSVQQQELFPLSAGVSMRSLLTASSGRICPQVLWGYFWMFLLIKSDCNGLFRQQSHFLLSLEEAAGCLLLWTA